MNRRDLLRLGLLSGAGTLIGGRAWADCSEMWYQNIEDAVNVNCGTGLEAMPYSPLILAPWTQDLPLGTPLTWGAGGGRKCLQPGYRYSDGTLAPPGASDAWTVRVKNNDQSGYISVPGPGYGYQDAMGDRPNGNLLPRAGMHQIYPGLETRWDGRPSPVVGYPAPLLYHIRLQVSQHRITTSRVLSIGISKQGKTKTAVIAPIQLPGGATNNGDLLTQNGNDPFFGTNLPAYNLPASTIYGFNGTFPGPIINAQYGQPVLVRFENDLDINPGCLDRQDFGAPDWAFLTHLHNGHSAPECDGNPHHMTDNGGGYQPGQWMDNLYLMYPAGNDPREKQSFLWFHDHRMHHTGANVYKGMVGLMPHYDTQAEDGFPSGRDPGDERLGLKLPGVKVPHYLTDGVTPDGTFDVDYDIPMAFYDCAMDDAVTPHFDSHQMGGACGDIHQEWWGQSFFRHYPNHGFVGDIFTVNGVAFPVLHVSPRRYRFRFLGASIARIYELSLRTAPNANVGTGQTGIGLFPGLQGQWNFATRDKQGRVVRAPGTQVMQMLQIASEGGLLNRAINRNSIQIWPAKRREVVVDFTNMNDPNGLNPIYLTNTLPMPDGRKPIFPGDKAFDRNYAVPLVKIIVDGPVVADNSNENFGELRPLPLQDPAIAATPEFILDRAAPLNPTNPGGGSEETEWVINGMEFDPITPLHTVTEDRPELWTVTNAGGGWVHPMHMHQEEHVVRSRSGSVNQHPEDSSGREDVVALDPSESVTFYRNFRTFCGKYVAHCHNLAHEDHNMMFGWTINPAP